MELFLKNTSNGLVPLYDKDYEEKRKLKYGEVYKATIKKARNYEFHKKYFALIDCAWEYQNEKTQDHFKNSSDNFRKTVEIAAGYSELFYSIDRKEWVESPKSISFDKLDNFEFQELYENVKTVLYTIFLKNINKDEFEKNLINF